MDDVIDVWMQHPTARFAQHEMFATLRRWTRGEGDAAVAEPPVSLTLRLMGRAATRIGSSITHSETW